MAGPTMHPFIPRSLAALLAAVLTAQVTPAATPPQRIVSLNLCADQLVLALADRTQIVGLTHNARDAEMSAEAERARGLHMMGTSAEEILALYPDLVVGQSVRRSAALRLLAGEHFATLDLKMANTLDDIYASIRDTASAVGHPERGEAMIAAMAGDLAALPKAGRGRVAVFYQRRGYVTGTGTLVDELITREGLANLARVLHKPVLAQMGLEEMVAAHPDFLIVESASDRVQDQGTEMLHHGALDGMKRISIPQAWTVCGGPAYVKAARAIAAALSAH
jgi:iron complex transport system substrate-binding protein